MKSQLRFPLFLCCTLLFAVVVVLAGAGCGGSRNLIPETPPAAPPGAGASTLSLQISLPQVNPQSTQQRRATRLEVEVFSFDGTSVALVDQALASPPPASVVVNVQGLSFPAPYRVVVRAFDENATKFMDTEFIELLSAGGSEFFVTLTPVEQTVSAIFAVVASVRITPRASQALREGFLDQLEAEGYTLSENRLVWPANPVGNWIVELDGKTYQTDAFGRLRVPKPPAGVTQGRIIHPLEPGAFATFSVSDLDPGQEPDSMIVWGITFNGGCGMNSTALGERPESEFCSPVEILDLPDVPTRILAQRSDQFPQSGETTNECLFIIPLTNEIIEFDRGTYAAPFTTRELNSGAPQQSFSICHDICEKFNGYIENRQRNNSGNTSYLGSTCYRYVRETCCLNENFIADVEFNASFLEEEDILRAYSGSSISRNQKLWKAVDRLRIAKVVEPVIPGKKIACLDNHKGRQCQQTKIGDISVDFRFSGKAQLHKPSDRRPVIQVNPGETVDFVLHNNGCFGKTLVTMQKKDLDGRLSRTFREEAIRPFVTDPTVTQVEDPRVRMQASTDPLLTNGGAEGVHPLTAGLFQLMASNATQDVTPEMVTPSGSSAPSMKVIDHFKIDPSIAANVEDCRRFRYFTDVALRYTAPTDCKFGQRDIFRFENDLCAQYVEFVMFCDPNDNGGSGTSGASGTSGGEAGGTSGGGTSGGTSGGDPMPNLAEASGNLVANHTVGTSPCPQSLGDLLIERVTDENVRIRLSVPAGTAIQLEQPTEFNLTGSDPLTVTTREIFFDCTTVDSFSTVVTVTVTRLSDGIQEIIEVPVTVNISG